VPVASVRLEADRILLDDVIEFEFDSARIRHRSHPLVSKVASFLADRDGILEVSIEGHADAVGPEAYNARLSEARAESTRDLLVHFGVDASRLRVVAHGAKRLKVATPFANARNRRVEFFVTRVQQAAAPPSGAVAGHRGEP
jgi:OmpA-OmpF porin, OOP family